MVVVIVVATNEINPSCANLLGNEPFLLTGGLDHCSRFGNVSSYFEISLNGNVERACAAKLLFIAGISILVMNVLEDC